MQESRATLVTSDPGSDPALVAERPTRGAPWYDHGLKRAMDISIAMPALLLALPLMVLIAAVIRLDSPGAALFRQARLGRGGRTFCLLKFRTMHQGADELLYQSLSGDPVAQFSWHALQKLRADPRVTRVGRILRRLSLDELPQLWNVLRGDMTMVGPRPILPDQATLYGPALAGYLGTRPGLTGLWQVSGRNRLSFLDRVARDQAYLETCSPGGDLRILARTLVAVAARDGAW